MHRARYAAMHAVSTPNLRLFARAAHASRTTPNPIWITSEAGGPYRTILTARPDSKDATWYDHWSEIVYVPNLLSAGAPARTPPSPSSLAVSAPQFVYSAAAAP
jgi:hypothetical protein